MADAALPNVQGRSVERPYTCPELSASASLDARQEPLEWQGVEDMSGLAPGTTGYTNAQAGLAVILELVGVRADDHRDTQVSGSTGVGVPKVKPVRQTIDFHRSSRP